MKAVNELYAGFSDKVCALFKKNVLVFHRALLKCFIYSRAGILIGAKIGTTTPAAPIKN